MYLVVYAHAQRLLLNTSIAFILFKPFAESLVGKHFYYLYKLKSRRDITLENEEENNTQKSHRRTDLKMRKFRRSFKIFSFKEISLYIFYCIKLYNKEKFSTICENRIH